MALRIDKPNKQLMLLNWTDFSINLNDQDQYVYEMTHFDLATAHIDSKELEKCVYTSIQQNKEQTGISISAL